MHRTDVAVSGWVVTDGDRSRERTDAWTTCDTPYNIATILTRVASAVEAYVVIESADDEPPIEGRRRQKHGTRTTPFLAYHCASVHSYRANIFC